MKNTVKNVGSAANSFAMEQQPTIHGPIDPSEHLMLRQMELMSQVDGCTSPRAAAERLVAQQTKKMAQKCLEA
jgi:hypothetical protein